MQRLFRMWTGFDRVDPEMVCGGVLRFLLEYTLQQRKRDIIQATLGGEDAFTAALSWDEIQELLA